MSKITPLNELEQWLDRYLNFERSPKKNIFWLDTMYFLCAKLNNPQNTYPCVHIAGSKGKGSVSVFIASILEKAGYKTGLFTSPHISDVSERIGSASKVFSDDVYAGAFKELCALIDSIEVGELPGEREPTWFELITLFSFICFKKAHIDWGIFETGLGGRLDSTNVVLPNVCIITPIELEHTEYLGETIEKIATEKAGIFKPDIPIFSAAQVPIVRRVFEQIAQNVGAPLTFLDDVKKQAGFSEFFAEIRSIPLRMAGKIQYENAELAAIALQSIMPDLAHKTIIAGLSFAFLPCRFEKIVTGIQNKKIRLVLDGAHTLNSLHACLQTFFEQYGADNHLLFACAKDKNVEGMVQLIKNSDCNFSKISLTVPGFFTQSNFNGTKKAFTSVFDARYISIDGSENCTESIHTAMNYAAQEDRVLLVVGSFYLAAAVKNLLTNENK